MKTLVSWLVLLRNLLIDIVTIFQQRIKIVSQLEVEFIHKTLLDTL